MRVFFEEGNLRLRAMTGTEEDLARMHRWLNDPEVLAYWDGRDNPYSLERVRANFPPQTDEDKGERRCFAELSGEPIGYVQFYPLDAQTLELYGVPEQEPGYGIDLFLAGEAVRGRGIGTRLMTGLLRYLFEAQAARVVCIDPQTWNARAIGCYLKCGFEPVKVLEGHEWHEGAWRDNLILRLRRAEWESPLTLSLRRHLAALGASLVGFADLRGLAKGPLCQGVSVALRMPEDVIASLDEGPGPAYLQAYESANAQLDRLVESGATWLADQGYAALAQTTGAVREFGVYQTAMPHKTVATRSGLGWIGRSALLVNPVYGSAVRLSSLLTDAPLACGEPTQASGCGECRACVEACPARAVTGATWSPGVARETLYDALSCRRHARSVALQRLGREITLCGRCIKACTHTQRHLTRAQALARQAEGPGLPHHP